MGLYAGLVVEPQGSLWYLPDGQRMNSRLDGGPTNWEGYIVTSPDGNSYREFAIEFQDTQLAYANTSRIAAGNEVFRPRGNPVTGPAAFDVGATTTPPDPGRDRRIRRHPQPGAAPRRVPADLRVQRHPAVGRRHRDRRHPGQPVAHPGAPGAAVNAGTSYIVWAANFIDTVNGVKLPFPIPTSLYVGTPEIEAGWVDSSNALNPPLPLASDPALGLGTPFPQLVSNGRVGTYSMNYRNESVIARVSPLAANDQLVKQIDMSYAFNSLTDRRDPKLNVQPAPGTPINPNQPNGFKFPPSVAPLLPPTSGGTPVPGVNEPGDPFTPLLRAYAGDPVQVRALVGAHTIAHSFQIQGVRWSFEPYYQNSGYKNAQAMGISEHFEMLFKLPPVAADHPGQALPPFADYLVSPSSTVEGLANGDWTIMRAFVEPSGRPGTPTYLTPLPNNPIDVVKANRQRLADRIKQVRADFDKLNTKQDQVQGNLRVVNVTATTVFQALPEQKLVFNPRLSNNPFELKNFFLFVPTADLDTSGRLKPDAPREPLILRARAGEWILVNLTNALPPGTTTDPVLTMTAGVNDGSPFAAPNPQTNLGPDPATVMSLPKGSVDPKLFGTALTSRQVGLHPALVNYDVTDSNGINIGFNPDATVTPGQTRSFLWYAGYLSADAGGVHEEPIEYGATNLISAEMMVQPQYGLVGALIVEPPGSDWAEDIGTRAAAR